MDKERVCIYMKSILKDNNLFLFESFVVVIDVVVVLIDVVYVVDVVVDDVVDVVAVDEGKCFVEHPQPVTFGFSLFRASVVVVVAKFIVSVVVVVKCFINQI